MTMFQAKLPPQGWRWGMNEPRATSSEERIFFLDWFVVVFGGLPWRG